MAARAARQPISFLIGRPHGQKTTAIASVIFPRPHWQRADAIAWLKRHEFKAAPLESLRGSFRAIQHPSSYFTRGTLRTIHTAGHAQPLTNPRVTVPAREYNQAVRLYQKFREAKPREIGVRRFHIPKMLMQVGRAHWLWYFTTHKGREVLYKHKFAPGAGPWLYASADGRRLYFLGGHYDFTRDGIVDRPPGQLFAHQAE